MKIDAYSFGEMVIDGKAYHSDLIIFPDRVKANWWRKEGHLLQLEDLDEIIAENPEVLIIGTGSSGIMKVPEALRKELLKKKIELYVADTRKAVEIFNSVTEAKRAIAAFHLTC